MSRHPQLSDWHLAGIFAVYPRVSSLAQLRDSVGSLLNQRKQVELLKQMGVPESQIRVYDADLGRSGMSVKGRRDWQALLEDITAGEVRGVAMAEVARLGRNDLELVKFFMLCESKNVLLLENGIPRNLREVGDWTLTRIQAVLAEQENRQRAQRSMAGRRAKTEAGFATWQLPPGLDRGPNGEAVKTANPVVRGVTERVLREGLQDNSVGRICRGLQDDGVKLWARGPRGTLREVEPTHDGVLRILKNPIYAGLLRLWRRRSERDLDGSTRIRRTTPEEQQWFEGKHVEGYITPEEHWRLQDLLARRDLRAGAPLRQGTALCARLVYCPRCKRRLHVAYAHTPGRRSHPPCHGYSCGNARVRRKPCLWVSGRVLDRIVEEIVLSQLRCPAPAALRRGIEEENERRQAGHRLLLAEVGRAEAEVAQAEARLEESRGRGKNPAVIELFENKLEQALQRAKEAKRRAAAAPPPALVDASAAFVGEVVAVFREFPRLWGSGRLGPRERRAVIRGVVRRIDVLKKGEIIRMRVVLHSGKLLGRAWLPPRGRRQLIERLFAKGRSRKEIAAELNRRGVFNKFGQPFDARDVSQVLRFCSGGSGGALSGRDQAAQEALRELWLAGHPQAEIAARISAQGFRTRRGTPWTAKTVLRWGKRLGLPVRWRIQPETVRGPLTELVEAGWDDAAIAEEFNARGLGSFRGTPWIPSRVKRVRLKLGIRCLPGPPPRGMGRRRAQAPRSGPGQGRAGGAMGEVAAAT